jgi:uncharacterized protein DUF4136
MCRGAEKAEWRGYRHLYRDTEDKVMGRLLLKAMTGSVAILLASGCAATMSVSSHVDRRLNFAQFRTFAWGPADALPTGDPSLDRDPFFKDYVQRSVARGLAARGLELASSGTPDLLIHYHANISERIDVNRADRVHGYCSAADCPPETVRYEAGTLVLDMIDSRTNKLVWRGWAQDSVEDLRNRNRMAKTIDQAVAKMLRQLPPMR